jgi:protein ImuB
VDRIACVDVPSLPLQLLLRQRPEWASHPVAVVDRDKAQGTILWVNEAARRMRILPGLRYAAGLSLSRELRGSTVSAHEIARAVDEIVHRLRFFSAAVEPSDEPGVFWLDASGLSLLYPSLQRWAELIVEDLHIAGLRVAAVVGFSRFATYALARAKLGARALSDPAREDELARGIALERLSLPPDVRDALHHLGIDTLGGFLDLPGPSVRKRFGPDVYRLHRLARNELWAPLQPRPNVELVRSQRGLDHAESDRERLLHLVEELLTAGLEQLKLRVQLVQGLRLELQLEDGPTRTEHLRPAHPTVEHRQLLDLLRLRLESIDLASGAEKVVLQLEGIAPGREQLSLFDDTPGRDLDAAQRALARLRAQLGNDAVQRAQLTEGHLPEATFAWEALDELRPATARHVHRRPLVRRLLSRPQALSRQRRNEPDGWMILGLEGGPVEEVHGPYVISGGWWVREVQREYHFVRTARSGWLWVYFDRRRRRWFLQGAVQ